MCMNIRGGFYFKPFTQVDKDRISNAKPEYQGQTLTPQPTTNDQDEDGILAEADKSLHDKQFRDADKIYTAGLRASDKSLLDSLLSADVRENIDAAIRDNQNKFNS